VSNPPLSLKTLFEVTPGGSNERVFRELMEPHNLDRLVPFIGAGLTCGAGFPLWAPALRKLADCIHFVSGATKEAIYKVIDAGNLDQAADDLYKAAEETEFVAALEQVFGATADQTVVAGLPVALLPRAFPTGPVVTTNFDTTLETRVFSGPDSFEQVIKGPARFKAEREQLIRGNPRWLFKWHGCVTAANEVVFTAGQYQHHYWKNNRSDAARFLGEFFRGRPMLFLGASLSGDRTVDLLAAIAKNDRRPHFALLSQDSDPDEFEEHGRLLSRAGIKAVWYPPGQHDYVRVLLEAIIEARTSAHEKTRHEDETSGPNAPLLETLTRIPKQRLMKVPALPWDTSQTAKARELRRGTDEDTAALDQLMRWVDDDEGTPLFALLGETGMGKTVTCQAFALALRERRQRDQTTRWPLYFDLRDVTLPGGRVPTLAEVMVECARAGWHRSDGVTAEDIWRWIDQGAVVIFDGLDELLNKLDDGEGRQLTKRLLSVVNQAGVGRPPKIVVSSRTQFFRSLRDERNRLTGGQADAKATASLEAWLVLPLSEAQVRAYLKAALPGEDVARLEETLTEVHDLGDLSQRPFTLSLVVDAIPQIEAWRAEGKPVYGSTLYRDLARQWLDRDREKDKVEPRHKYALVEELAAHLWREDLTTVPVDDLEDWFHEWRQGRPGWAIYDALGSDKLTEALRNATFLSRDHSANEGAFRFAHTSLQEFFLSEYLLRALRENAPERWAMRTPSDETLDFLGQSLAETGGARELATMARWFRGDSRAANTVILGYRLRASDHGWPQVDLPVQFVNRGATSDTIVPGEKVRLGGNVWRVLDVEEKAGTALLLSEHLVAYRAYHDEFTEVVWHDCALRTWLNDEFFPGLPADFAALVVETKNENPDSRWRVPGGPATTDKVFLLDGEDMERYFPGEDATRVSTRHDGQPWWWWLRSPGGRGTGAAGVLCDGYVSDGGTNVNNAAGGVRPALTIRIPRS
jgi:hypothetical protein